ncbi:uracil-DNA glycosylase family protein [Roseisolibacter sp. H3M3-2]|uniref:uracil-DNA glycosylase family protein n=1 Tax=Roseisolibacter sp. H3M3-2 TaxID=3031323 RepID=UPI0023DA95A7|nr:uracil-DNA glycosylase family protein [Roseisolibacter sp. H3M3-2]MDF1503203.1 uracil-DNA glycosylase family protein [Roseisolibacter sp. H3M3-2]
MSPLPILDLAPALEAHRRALAACRRCAATLPAGARPVVSHAVAPRVMIVGQAPGPSEATGGRPFVGRSGRTLFRWLAEAGLGEEEARAAILIAAVTRCYPGPSPSGRGDRVATPAERGACAPWLDRELALLRPALVIPIGRLAIDRLLGPLPLAAVVGRVHPVVAGGVETRAVPLPHPSGASGWLNAPAHRALLDDAITHLADEFARVGLIDGGRRAAA